jgi:uncharacterized protein
MRNYNLQALGAGIGLRHRYLREILEKRPPFNWFEVIVEDFFDSGGEERELLQAISDYYPLVAHGVCLSVGSTDPLDFGYLKKLKTFISDIKSPWASDHLCFTRVDHSNLNDLLPLPYTQECLENVVMKLRIVQDYLEVPFLMENISRYVTPSSREMSELEFLTSVLELSGCGLLLDLTNVFLNAHHHTYDIDEYLRNLPLERVGQVHVAGWEPDSEGELIDSHDAPVPDEIWQLFEDLTSQVGPTSVLIEWDKELPEIEVLMQEAERADSVIRRFGKG